MKTMNQGGKLNDGKVRLRVGVKHGLPFLKNALVAVVRVKPSAAGDVQDAVQIIKAHVGGWTAKLFVEVS